MTDQVRSSLGFYDRGRTPFFALQSDKRLSYCLYVPESYDEAADKTYRLIVLVHGTDRDPSGYRDSFAAFADANDCIVLAPLFPVGLGEPGDLDNYKFIDYAGIRFDLATLAMVDEVASRYRLASQKFFLHGFSGGGHFTHRMLFLHPHRLAAASIGAPGVVTLLDRNLPWWRGLRDIEERFGVAFDLDAIRSVPVHLVIGGADTETWEITLEPGTPWWMDGANDAGATRLDRMSALKASLESAGMRMRYDIIPGVSHELDPLLGCVKAFIKDVIDGDW